MYGTSATVNNLPVGRCNANLTTPNETLWMHEDAANLTLTYAEKTQHDEA
jgi:hypothetical protein